MKRVIEAALFMATRPLSLEELSKICNSGNIGLIRKCVEELKEEYAKRNSGIEILKLENGSYKMKVITELEPQVANLAPMPEISSAILKTLALIAYEQPITQSRIVKERGNRAYKYIKTLLKEEFISAEKYKRTKILRTTPKFKEYFQIKDLKEELKKLEEKRKERKEEEKLNKNTKFNIIY